MNLCNFNKEPSKILVMQHEKEEERKGIIESIHRNRKVYYAKQPDEGKELIESIHVTGG